MTPSDSEMPATGPDEEKPVRRAFLKWAVGGMAIVWGGIVGWPLLASLVGPMYRKLSGRFVKVGVLDTIPEGTPTPVRFPYVTDEGYMHEAETHVVWVIRSPGTAPKVFSPICPHLACRFSWSPGARHFVCPCHGSVFSIDGAVLAGPSPRPLDTLPHKVELGELLVKWEQFKPGVAEKTQV